jgi:hypothetical protein
MQSQAATFYQQIRHPLLVLKFTGSLFIEHKNGRFEPSSSRLTFSIALACLCLSVGVVHSIFEKISDISQGIITTRSFVTAISRINYMVIIFLCVRFVIFQRHLVAEIFNKFQIIQRESVASLRNFPGLKISIIIIAYTVLVVAKYVHTFSIYRPLSMLRIILLALTDTFVTSLTLQPCFILCLLKCYLTSANSALSLKNINLLFLDKLRNSVSVTLDVCDMFQNIYGPILLAVTMCRSLYFVIDVYMLAACVIEQFFATYPRDLFGVGVSSLVWLCLDLSVIVGLIFFCSSAENEVCLDI